MNHIALGDAGENIAAEYLKRSGYRILARKFRGKTGEIDIIVDKGGMISFIEVKTRTSTWFGTPAEAVNLSKQRKIINTAMYYLKQTAQADIPFQFDILEIMLDPASGKARCNHIQNAFGR